MPVRHYTHEDCRRENGLYDRTLGSELYSGKRWPLIDRQIQSKTMQMRQRRMPLRKAEYVLKRTTPKQCPCSCIMTAGNCLKSSSWPLLQMFHEAEGAKGVKSRSARNTQQKGILAVT